MTHDIARNAGLRAMLIERRRQLQTEMRGRLRDGRAEKMNDVRDDLEVSDADTQSDVELALIQMRAELLRRIDEALVRLDADEYGSCVDCVNDIPASRLRALPFAVRCMACEQRREHRSGAQQRGERRNGFSLFPDVVGS